jgi:predicted thioredoxin/glutaredoxin
MPLARTAHDVPAVQTAGRGPDAKAVGQEGNMKLFVSKGCPECMLVKDRLQRTGNPKGVEVFDTSTADGLAEAAYHELTLLKVPVLLTDEGAVIKDLDSIVWAVG